MAAGNRDVTSYGAIAKGNAPYVITKKVDFNDAVTVKGGAIEANEVLQAMDIPAGVLVLGVFMEILTPAAGTALTAVVGDGDAADGWYKNGSTYADMKAVAGTIYYETRSLAEATPNTFVPAFGVGKFYAAADTIDIKVIAINTITTLPVVQLSALVLDVGSI